MKKALLISLLVVLSVMVVRSVMLHRAWTESAKIEFLKRMPTAKIVKASIGEGDAEHAYVLISYLNAEGGEESLEMGLRSLNDKDFEVFYWAE